MVEQLGWFRRWSREVPTTGRVCCSSVAEIENLRVTRPRFLFCFSERFYERTLCDPTFLPRGKGE